MSDLKEELTQINQAEQRKRISLGHIKFVTTKEPTILKGWGLVDPYLGEELARTSTEHWIGWQGQPNLRQEIPLLVARAGLNQIIDHDTFWSYGYTTVQELEQSADPAETILDAAYLIDTVSGSRVLTSIIHSLAEIVPPLPVSV